jgi:hypothetical protein
LPVLPTASSNLTASYSQRLALSSDSAKAVQLGELRAAAMSPERVSLWRVRNNSLSFSTSAGAAPAP